MTDPQAPDTDIEIDVREWWPSSNIEGVGYDGPTRTLEVRFKGGGVYRYGDVRPYLASPLLTEEPEPITLGGSTPGEYLNRVIVRNEKVHPFVKMEAENA